MDPEPDELDTSNRRYEKRDKIRLDYTNIVTPKNMRSHFWAYFGFPGDENDRVITKSCVVCTLCNSVMRHHNNTTNLRAHMQSTHKEYFIKICKANHITVPPRKSQKNAHIKRIAQTFTCEKKEISESDEDDSCNQYIEDSENILIEHYFNDATGDMENYGDGADGDVKCVKSLEHDDTSDEIRLPSSQDESITPDIVKIESTSATRRLDHNKKLNHYLLQILIKDLKPLYSLQDEGFSELIKFFTKDDVPVDEVNNDLYSLYESTQNKVKMPLIEHSLIKPYSLGFEIWKNIEEKDYINMYFNYIPSTFDESLHVVLFDVFEYTEHVHFSSLLDGLNLENCSAAVTNCNSHTLEDFLTENDIPIVPCYKNITNKCLRDVFNIERVRKLICEIEDILIRHSNILQAENVEIPTTNTIFPWTKYNLLKFFIENISWPEEMNEYIASAKLIVDALSPVEITLETLSEDQNPLSSLVKPLTQKLIEKHYDDDSNYDNTLLEEIKKVIKTELSESLLSNDLLTVTALLDPRFHRFLNINLLDAPKKIIRSKAKLHNIIKNEDKETVPVASSTKKTNLKSFFEASGNPSKRFKEDNIDWDLRRYQSDAYADLDQSSLVWWSKYGYMYGGLKTIADIFNCIPCCVNTNFKLSHTDEMKYHNKRYNLSGEGLEKILYLHFNLERC